VNAILIHYKITLILKLFSAYVIWDWIVKLQAVWMDHSQIVNGIFAERVNCCSFFRWSNASSHNVNHYTSHYILFIITMQTGLIVPPT